jgi:hypothetical protein
MFGAGIPILFPIALMSMMIMYTVEKGMLYYGYREPPQYDDVLNNSVINTLRYAPVFCLSFSYWMLSSK